MIKSKKVVIIMTDTQRWDMINAYKNTGLKTPCLDKMASEGMLCNHAYTTQPVCQPARAGIFTGQFPSTVCSWTNTMGLGDNIHTIGERLEKHGVHTAYMGKWHLDAGDYFGNGVAPKGWDKDYWYDMKVYLKELSLADRKIVRTKKSMEEMDVKEEIIFAHNVSNKALDFLENHNEEDFLLVVSYDEPHGPYTCPAPFSTMYKDYDFPRTENLWDTLETKPVHQQVWGADNIEKDKNTCIRAPHEFFGCNSYVDYEIGRVLEAIDKYAEDAVVFYTSDHGDLMLSHNLTSKGPCTYDENARIPFIVKGKGIPQGVVNENPVSHINIVPTIMEMMDVEIPPVIQGKSIAKELADPSVRTNDYVFIEFGRYESVHDTFGGFQPLRGIYDGKFKLTVNLLSTDEMYDMENDPQEMINLIENPEYFAIRDKLHNALLDHMNDIVDPFRGYYWENRPWRKDATKPTWDYTNKCRGIGADPEFDYGVFSYVTGEKIR